MAVFRWVGCAAVFLGLLKVPGCDIINTWLTVLRKRFQGKMRKARGDNISTNPRWSAGQSGYRKWTDGWKTQRTTYMLVRVSERFHWTLLTEARPGPPLHWVPPASLHLQPDAPGHRETPQLSAQGRPDVHLPRGPEMWLRGLSDQHHWVHHISVEHKHTHMLTTRTGKDTSSSRIITNTIKQWEATFVLEMVDFGAWVCGRGRQINFF